MVESTAMPQLAAESALAARIDSLSEYAELLDRELVQTEEPGEGLEDELLLAQWETPPMHEGKLASIEEKEKKEKKEKDWSKEKGRGWKNPKTPGELDGDECEAAREKAKYPYPVFITWYYEYWYRWSYGECQCWGRDENWVETWYSTTDRGVRCQLHSNGNWNYCRNNKNRWAEYSPTVGTTYGRDELCPDERDEPETSFYKTW